MSSNQPQIFNPPDVIAPKPTYSHICTIPLSNSTRLVTIAGQIGIDSSTGKVPPTYTEQVAAALSNLGKCLAAAGATPRDIIKVTHYIVNHDPADRSRGGLYLSFMGDHRPPSTLVGVAALAEPELLYEIEAMAIVTD